MIHQALADISSKVDQVRNDLPAEAQVPAISVQSPIRNSPRPISASGLRSCLRTDHRLPDSGGFSHLAAVTGVQRIEIFGARTFAMRVWLKPDHGAH